MTLAAFLDACMTQLKAQGLGWPENPITQEEVEQLATSYRMGRTPENAARMVRGGGLDSRRPWEMGGGAA